MLLAYCTFCTCWLVLADFNIQLELRHCFKPGDKVQLAEASEKNRLQCKFGSSLSSGSPVPLEVCFHVNQKM